MSVFTHGVTLKGKLGMINRNKVFPVARGHKTLETTGGRPPRRARIVPKVSPHRLYTVLGIVRFVAPYLY
jgi:hypothetical protein